MFSILTTSECDAYISPYLSDGWRKDYLEWEKVILTPGQVRGVLQLGQISEIGKRDGFHLNSAIAMVYVMQLLRITTAYKLQMPHDALRSAYITKMDIKCKRPVTEHRMNFEVNLTKRKEFPSKNLVFFEGNFSIQDKAFFGELQYTCGLDVCQGQKTLELAGVA